VSRWEDDLVDPFLADVPEDADVGALVESLGGSPEAPSAELRAKLLGEVGTEGRFERFVATAAEILDVDEGEMRRLLDGIADDANWHGSPFPDVNLFDVEGGPRVAGAITGFVRMPAGAAFPEHHHLGDETVLVLQGSCEDGVSGEVVRPGDVARRAAGTAHDFRARPGPDLVFLVVVQRGLRIGDVELGPNAPEI
jgi:quercetin dioxygenase-like cupin family protein